MSARSTESATRPKRSKLEKEQKRIAKLARTRRILWSTLAGGLLASFVFLLATSTTAWVTLSMPHAVYRNATGAYVLQQYSGLWRNCWKELYNSTQQHVEREYCRMRKFFPSKETVETDDEIDYGILDYSRSEAAFAVISLVLSSLPNFFTWYSIEEPRYTFKRLAGGLHLITAGCIVVCIEVFKSSLDYERKNLPARFPSGASVTFGYSIYLAWVSFALFVFVSITMFVMSHKRKGEKARTTLEAMENEPIIIGRI